MGRCVTWDVTRPDTLAASHRQITAYASGAASERAAMLKHTYQVPSYQGSSRFFTNRGRNPWTYIKQWGFEIPHWIGWSTFHSVSWPEGILILVPESVRVHAAGKMPLLSTDPYGIFLRFATTRGWLDRTSVREIFILRVIFKILRERSIWGKKIICYLTTTVDSVGEYDVSDGIHLSEIDHQPVRTTGSIVGVWKQANVSVNSFAGIVSRQGRTLCSWFT